MRTPTLLLAVLLAAPVLGASNDASPWPGWRGPGGQGVASGSAPLEWGAEQNVLWKSKVEGRGHSSPIVWNDLIVVTTAVQGTQLDAARAPEHTFAGQAFKHPMAVGSDHEHTLKVVAYRAETGEVAWEHVAYSGPVFDDRHSESSYASPTPVTDGERLYVYFGSEGVFAYGYDGELAWSRDIGDIKTVGLGVGTSPVLAGDLLVLQADEDSGDDSFIVALDRKTGDEVWKTARPVQASWTTPVVLERGGVTQIVTSGNEHVISYDAASGEELWRGEGLLANAIHVPMVHEDLLIFTTGYPQKNSFALRLDEEGRADVENRVWAYPKGTGYVPSNVVYDGRLYLTSDGGVITCLDAATGEVVYEGGRPPVRGKLTASLVAADGRILEVNENGEAVWFRAGPEYEVLAVNDLDEPVYATPAVAGGRIYIRGNQHLFAIGAKGEGAPDA